MYDLLSIYIYIYISIVLVIFFLLQFNCFGKTPGLCFLNCFSIILINSLSFKVVLVLCVMENSIFVYYMDRIMENAQLRGNH